MEITYDGTLVMPLNCTLMSEEEMSYVDGGYYVNHQNCNALRFAIGATSAHNAAAIASLISAYGAGGLMALASSIPFVGWVVGLVGVGYITRSAKNLGSALFVEMKKKKGIDVKIRVSGLKCSAR